MSEALGYDRLTSERAREIGKVMTRDRGRAVEFIKGTISRLEEMLPSTRLVRADRIEDAFMVAAETKKIFNTAGLNVWDFVPKEPHSLSEYVFLSALGGKALSEIIENGIKERLFFVNAHGELWSEGAKFTPSNPYAGSREQTNQVRMAGISTLAQKPNPTTITLRKLAAEIAANQGIPKRETEGMLSDLVGMMVKHLKKGERIRIGKFGVLQVRKRAARMGRNPATGEPIKIKASKKVAFRASKELKEAV
jgi:DNA-binding protein HU-beta